MAQTLINNLSYSTLDATKLSGNLPAISGASLTGVGGLVEYDIWLLSTTFTGNANPIASNLQRSGVAGFNKIGTGMTESSGIFTFPSTGFYEIGYYIMQYPATERFTQHTIDLTTNNSSYASAVTVTVNLSDIGGGIDGQMGVGHTLFDVTDTTQCKVRFHANQQNTSSGLHGNTSYHYTYMTFKKMGDT